MAQHDMNIANQGFPATRADINNALQALASNNSGTSAPSTMFANQWWYDTQNNKLYIRNEANNAWIQVAVLDQTNNEWQITTGQISASDGDGLVFKTDDGNTRITLSDGGDVTFADGTDIITASAGTDNVRLGAGAGDSIASGGNNNVAVGKNAGTAMTTATNSVFVGALAGDATVGAANNTGVGYQSLSANAGNKNTAVGSRAGVAVTGVNNTIIGEEAGLLCTGDGNTFVGAYGASTGGSGEAMTTGSKNTILGAYTGNQSGLDIRTSSNHIVLSDGDGDVPFFINSSHGMKVDGGSGDLGSTTDPTHEIVGGFGNSHYLTRLRVTSSVGYTLALQFANSAPNNSTQTFIEAFDNVGHKFRVTSAGDVLNANNSYGSLSDVKLKENIDDSGSQWNDVKAIRVRKYSMKEDALDAPNRLGVIAQELEDAGMNNLINEIPDATPDNPDLTTTTKTVKYSVLYMKAIKALQEAMTRIETLEAQNTTQATQIADLISRVETLES